MQTFDTIVVSAGHNSRRTGAHALGRKEHHLTLVAAQALVEELQALGVHAVFLDPMFTLSERVAKVNSMGPHVLALEIHFNSFNGKAHGAEVFYRAGDKSSFDLGKQWLQESCTTMGLMNRGMKLASASARGSLAWLKCTHGLLWEICFMDNPTDMERVLPLDTQWVKTVAPLISKSLHRGT